MDVHSSKAGTIKVSYESWRVEDHLIKGTEFRANSYKKPQRFDIITFKGEVSFKGNEVLFYHRNRNDIENVFDYTVQLEAMDSVKSRMFNPIKNNTFGGVLKGAGMKPGGIDSGRYADASFRAWSLKTNKPVRSQQIEIGLHVDQANIKEYIPFIESCLSFYDEHYQQLAKKLGSKTFDEKGQYVFYPSSACETFKMTYNSTTVIAALKVILERMLELPDKYIDSLQRKKWTTKLKRIPPIPFRNLRVIKRWLLL